MRRISIMATFPARTASVAVALESIATQVDKTIVVLNEYAAVPPQLATRSIGNVEFVIPSDDLKDTGKFFYSIQDDDQVFLCDDDVGYPPDYVARMAERWDTYRSIDAIVGVHGMIYTDFFDGDPAARLVHKFTQGLDDDVFVNQLGTATVLCSGRQMPGFEFMRTSRRFVDVRFAVHCALAKIPLICIARENGWLKQLPIKTSIYETFTQVWPLEVVAEAQRIAGFRFLPAATPAALAGHLSSLESVPGNPKRE